MTKRTAPYCPEVRERAFIHQCGPWRSFEAAEFAAPEWVDWFNRRRLLEPIRRRAVYDGPARSVLQLFPEQADRSAS